MADGRSFHEDLAANRSGEDIADQDWQRELAMLFSVSASASLCKARAVMESAEIVTGT